MLKQNRLYRSAWSQTGSVFLRLAFVCCVMVLSSKLMPSEWLARFTGKPAAVVAKLEGYPSALLAFLLIGFVLLNHKSFIKAETKLPSLSGIILTWLALGISILLTFNLTHPPYHLLVEHVNLANQSPLFYAPLLGSMYKSILYIPFLPIIAAVFSFAFLKRYSWQFVVILLIVLLSIFGTFLEARYHFLLFGSTVKLVQSILELIGQNVTSNYQTMKMSNEAFSVYIGPACSGFRFTILFSLLYAVTWFALARKSKSKSLPMFFAFFVGLGLLFEVNVLRIASIMIVGRYSPHLALILFHELAGTVLFFIVFSLYLKFVVLKICTKKKS